MATKGESRKRKIRSLNEQIHTTVYEIDKHQGPMYRTGSSTQYLIMNYMGKSLK